LLAWLKVKPVDPQTKEVNSNKNTGHTPHEAAPVLASESGIPKPISHQEEATAKRRKVPGWLKFVVNVLTLAAVTWYACEARKQRVAMDNTFEQVQKQTTLARQQLVGTQAAVVVINDYPGIESPQTNQYGFDIGFRNDGHVIASNVEVLLTVRRETVHGAKPVGEPWHCDFGLSPIAPTKVGEHQCFLEGLTARTWQPIGEFKQTIAVDGHFSYWNGFEDASPIPICLRYVPSGIKSKYGSEGPGRFVSCDRYPEWIEYLRARIAGEEVYRQPN